MLLEEVRGVGARFDHELQELLRVRAVHGPFADDLQEFGHVLGVEAGILEGEVAFAEDRRELVEEPVAEELGHGLLVAFHQLAGRGFACVAGFHPAAEFAQDLFGEGGPAAFDEEGGVFMRKPVLIHEPGAGFGGEFGEAGAFLFADGGEFDGREVWFGEIAVVRARLFGALRDGLLAHVIPAARFGNRFAAFVVQGALALDLELEGPFHRAERVHVLDLDLRVEFGLERMPFVVDGEEGDVGIAAHVALFHVRVGGLDGTEEGLQLLEEGLCLLRRAEVWIGDDLQKGRAGAVQVDEGGAGLRVMDVFGGVFLKVRARDADRADPIFGEGGGDREGPAFDDGLVELGDLVALGEVGIEIVLAVERGAVADGAVEGEADADTEADGLLVHDRQGAGLAAAGGADGAVGRRGLRNGRATAKHLRGRLEAHVDLQADDRDVAVHAPILASGLGNG